MQAVLLVAPVGPLAMAVVGWLAPVGSLAIVAALLVMVAVPPADLLGAEVLAPAELPALVGWLAPAELSALAEWLAPAELSALVVVR